MGFPQSDMMTVTKAQLHNVKDEDEHILCCIIDIAVSWVRYTLNVVQIIYKNFEK